MSSEIITIASFVTGLIVGVALTTYGFKLGFKASYQIRETFSDDDMPETLLKNREDPREFDLLEQEEP